MIVGRAHTVKYGRLRGEGPSGPVTHEGRGPCVVVFHGFTGTTAEVRPLVDHLAGRGMAVHAPLLPGHGGNPSELQDKTWRDWVEAMTAEVDVVRRRHESFVLCGFSLGSLVASELAARRIPGLAGLVVLGNALVLNRTLDAVLGLVERRRWRIPDWYGLKLWSSNVRDASQAGKIVGYDRDPLRAALEVYRAGRHVEPRLREIACPVLILHGAKDLVCPSSNAARFASRLGTKDARTVVYPRSAHLLAADHDREEVAAEVATFVEGLGSCDSIG